MAMSVSERGVSGRARLLTGLGRDWAPPPSEESSTIRRTVRQPQQRACSKLKVGARRSKGRPTAWSFTGGGWGHGVGICQTGAIGRAEAGQAYRQILKHYFSGAQVAKIY
jgi:stage II sporulation protein D